MQKFNEIAWHDPRKKIWGFHLHQELPLADFTQALVIQKKCSEFLIRHDVPIDNDDVIEPGYGPHLDYMWELRVESETDHVLEKMGLAISYFAINRLGLSGYIHPLMHDVSASEEEMLAAEGRDNQANATWFTYKVPQNQDFFFHPPKNNNNQIVDTRTSRIISLREKNTLLNLGLKKTAKHIFQDPYALIIGGFHLHMDFSASEEALALMIFDKFLIFLSSEEMKPTSTRIYGPGENGPHLMSGWEVKFETDDKTILKKIGIAIAWLMCNRQSLSVFMHPVTWHEGEYREELKAHQEYSFFIGDMPALDLTFFSNKFTDSIPTRI